MAQESLKEEVAVVTIDEMLVKDTDFVKFKAQGYTFNYKYNPEFMSQNVARGFEVGKHLRVTYVTLPPKGDNKYGSRYIRDASKAGDADANTFTPKPAYKGGKGGGGDYRRPDQIIRSNALTAAVDAYGGQGCTLTPDEFVESAKVFEKYIAGAVTQDTALQTATDAVVKTFGDDVKVEEESDPFEDGPLPDQDEDIPF